MENGGGFSSVFLRITKMGGRAYKQYTLSLTLNSIIP